MQQWAKQAQWLLSGLCPTQLKQLQPADAYKWQNHAAPCTRAGSGGLLRVMFIWSERFSHWRTTVRSDQAEMWVKTNYGHGQQTQCVTGPARLLQRLAGSCEGSTGSPHLQQMGEHRDVKLVSQELTEEQPLQSTHSSKWEKTVTVSLGTHLIQAPTQGLEKAGQVSAFLWQLSHSQLSEAYSMLHAHYRLQHLLRLLREATLHFSSALT